MATNGKLRLDCFPFFFSSLSPLPSSFLSFFLSLSLAFSRVPVATQSSYCTHPLDSLTKPISPAGAPRTISSAGGCNPGLEEMVVHVCLPDRRSAGRQPANSSQAKWPRFNLSTVCSHVGVSMFVCDPARVFIVCLLHMDYQR